MSVNMSDLEEDPEELKEVVYDLFLESMERFGYNHPGPPKLLDYFLEELGIKMDVSVDAEIRRILGSHAIEPRSKSSLNGHIPDSERCHNQTTSLAPQMFSNVGKIPPGPFKGTFASYIGLFVPIRDFKENLKSRKEGDQQYLWNVCERATGLAALAHKNLRHAVSEYTWESDVRDQLFKTMRTDPRISM
jgi:hypothetical protein